jgi:hypothetical protein
VKRPRIRVAVLVVVLCLAAMPAGAQLSLPPGTPALPPTGEPARRGPITITPTLGVTGEYNDNVFQDNDNRVDDFIIAFTPGIAVTIETPIYRLLGSYSFTAEIYADNTELNDAFARHDLQLEGEYRVSPRLTLSLTETLAISNYTNAVSTEAVSTGRTGATSNTLSPGVAYQLTPRTTLRGRGTWTLLRYDTDAALDSDTYAVEGFVDHAFTPRLTGSAGYQFAYFDVQDVAGTSTHTPRVGLTYRFTPTLTGSLSGGPSFVVSDDDFEVTPALTAAVQQRFSWGALSAQYDRAVGTAGGLGGTTDNQTVAAILQVDGLVRGLTVQFSPRYTHLSSTFGDEVDIDTFSLTLQARYQINRWLAAFGGYNFYLQRSSSSTVTGAGTVTATDVDQNRVFVGLQFGYPIRID